MLCVGNGLLAGEREAEKLGRRLTVILGWEGIVWSWREVNGFEIYFEDRVNMLMNLDKG